MSDSGYFFKNINTQYVNAIYCFIIQIHIQIIIFPAFLSITFFISRLIQSIKRYLNYMQQTWQNARIKEVTFNGSECRPGFDTAVSIAISKRISLSSMSCVSVYASLKTIMSPI